jgi:muconolactone delta-isomerase
VGFFFILADVKLVIDIDEDVVARARAKSASQGKSLDELVPIIWLAS